MIDFLFEVPWISTIEQYGPVDLFWLLSLSLVHGIVGSLLVRWLTPYPAWMGFFWAMFPDVDGLIHVLAMSGGADAGILAHRGLTHTATFALAVPVLLTISGRSDRVVHASFIGIWSHLIFDIVSGWGVMLLWPLDDTWIFIDLGLNAPEKVIGATAILSIAWVVLTLNRSEPYSSIDDS